MSLAPTLDRDAWLDARRGGIGSSDAAAVLGLDPFRTPLELWAEKRGLGEPQPVTFAMRRGLALEDAILDEAERLLGCGPLQRQVYCASAARPWQTATLDGLSESGLIVEAKCVGRRQWAAWGDEGLEEVPNQYLVQVQHQLAVTGRDEAVIAADLGGEVKLYPVRRDERLIEQINEAEAAFWLAVVEGRAPAVSDPADAEVLHRLYPRPEGEIDLPPDVAELADLYAEHGRVARESEAAKAILRAKLIEALGPAASGTLPDGRVVVRRVQTRKAYTVAAAEFVTLTVKGGGR